MEDETQALRAELVRYVRRKFAGRDNICDLADDIVNQSFADVSAKNYNFGYLSRACVHAAYKIFKKADAQRSGGSGELLWFVDAEDVVEEIIRAQDAREILDSLQTLKEIEQIILTQRYYGDYSFAEISRRNGLKLSTVLSHHRRALEKLRPRLAQFAQGRVRAPQISAEPGDTGFSRFL